MAKICIFYGKLGQAGRERKVGMEMRKEARGNKKRSSMKLHHGGLWEVLSEVIYISTVGAKTAYSIHYI
jgi:hypothetical protein